MFLYGVCYNTVLLVLDHPQEHMAGCLHQQPVEAFSLPAWCAPVDLESCRPGCSVRLAHLSSRERNAFRVNTTDPTPKWKEHVLIEFDRSPPSIIPQQRLSRTGVVLSPFLSREIPLSGTRRAVQIREWASPRTVALRGQKSGASRAHDGTLPHTTAPLSSFVFSWLIFNEYKCYESGREHMTFINVSLSQLELLQERRRTRAVSVYYEVDCLNSSLYCAFEVSRDFNQNSVQYSMQCWHHVVTGSVFWHSPCITSV